MIGNRLKLKRQADRLSLQELSDLVSECGASITKGALSNYENGKVVPSGASLQALCQALGVSEAFLNHEETPLDLRYFADIGFVPLRQDELNSYVACHLELRLDIDRVLGIESSWRPPDRITVTGKSDLGQVSEYAEEVRKQWGLNEYPVSSVTFTLEKQGWDVYELPAAFGLPGVSGYDAISWIPFVYYPTRAGLVNVRMQMLMLIADAYLDIRDPSLRREACRRFATAFLLTGNQALEAFGPSRTAIGRDELEAVKHHYGLPKYEIMNRLLELGIIEERLHRVYFSSIRQHGYPSARDSLAEPLFFYENSSLYKQRVQKALAEGLLDGSEDLSSSFLPSIHR